MPRKSNAEYQRQYRERKKAEKSNAEPVKDFDLTTVPGRIDAAFEIVQQDIVIDQLKDQVRAVKKAAKKAGVKLVEPTTDPADPPIFTDRDAGLPRSNYFGGSFADGIQKMNQKRIDAILDRVNTHKNIRGH